MKARLLMVSIAGVGALAALACKDATGVYPGGPAGSAAALRITRSAFVMRQADTTSLGAFLTDSAGNAVAGAATIASCDASIVTVTAGTAPAGANGLAVLTAAGVGRACVTVTAGSLVDTAVVEVGPYTLTITGPAAGARNQSYYYHVTAYDAAGAAVAAPFVRSWSSTSNNFKTASVSGAGDSVKVSSNNNAGTFRVVVTAFGGATAFLSVVIT